MEPEQGRPSAQRRERIALLGVGGIIRGGEKVEARLPDGIMERVMVATTRGVGDYSWARGL